MPESRLPLFNIQDAESCRRACMLAGMCARQIRHSRMPSAGASALRWRPGSHTSTSAWACELGRTCMLIYMVALANAASSPIILPFALWWFIIGWIFWRYSILYVFERSTESGGMVRALLPVWIHPRMAWALHLETCTDQCSTGLLDCCLS